MALIDGQARTLDDVARSAGVTRERVRQIEAKTPAKLRHPMRPGPNGAGQWTRFTYSFPPQPSGTYELWARATDANGRTQPETVPLNTLGYLFGAIVRHPVVIH